VYKPGARLTVAEVGPVATTPDAEPTSEVLPFIPPAVGAEPSQPAA